MCGGCLFNGVPVSRNNSTWLDFPVPFRPSSSGGNSAHCADVPMQQQQHRHQSKLWTRGSRSVERIGDNEDAARPKSLWDSRQEV